MRNVMVVTHEEPHVSHDPRPDAFLPIERAVVHLIVVEQYGRPLRAAKQADTLVYMKYSRAHTHAFRLIFT